MSSYVNCLGGTCPHMPFFIGGHMSGGGGGEMSYTHIYMYCYKCVSRLRAKKGPAPPPPPREFCRHTLS